MERTKTINALKARHNLGQLMNEVVIKEEDCIIERAGKPLVAVISIEKYRRFEAEKYDFFKWVDEVRKKTKNVEPKKLKALINEAVIAAKQKSLKKTKIKIK